MKKRNSCSGSLTLEAALVVPMFIILMLVINGIFVMFMGQQIMSHVLLQSAKSMAFDPYASQRVAGEAQSGLATMFVDVFSFSGGDHISTEKWYESGDAGSMAESRFHAYLKESGADADALLDAIGVKGGAGGLDFSGSSVQDGILTLKLHYTQEFIFNAADLAAFDRELSVKVKLFEYHR